jgi:Outer membrane lipoprotein-sorting protein
VKVKFIVLAVILFLGFAAAAQTTNGLPPAEIEGRQLAAEILSVTPVTNLIQNGTLKIRNPEGTTSVPITFLTTVKTSSSWDVEYAAMSGTNTVEHLQVVHEAGRPNEYYLAKRTPKEEANIDGILLYPPKLSPKQIMSPFAGSDFWIADLGVEFFHWPEQIVTGHETRRTRACTVLESHNPRNDNGYSRVVTWIDNETLGIIHAEAYDTHDKLLKVFDPKSLKKVNGQWELQDIEIQNVQTHSRTRIRFNLTSG